MVEDVAVFLDMELITFLYRCYHLRGFAYQHARFGPGHKSIGVTVRSRTGSAALCSTRRRPGTTI